MRVPATPAAATTDRVSGKTPAAKAVGPSGAATSAVSLAPPAAAPPAEAFPAAGATIAPAATMTPAAAPSAGPPEPPKSRLRYLESLAAISNAINANLDLDRMLPVLVEKAAELLKVPAASVMLVDEGRQEIRIRAARGLSPAYVQALQQPLEASIAGRALSEGRVFATWDARQAGDPRAAEAAAREGIVSIACAPMLFAGKPIGVLNVYCHDSHCFSTDQFHVLALLAAQGAVAVTNARLYRDSRAYAAEVRASFGRVGAALASSLDVGETLRLIVQLAVEMTRAEAGAMFMLAEEREGGGLVLSAARGLDRRSVRRFRRMPPSPVAQRALAERRVVYVPDTRRQTDTAFPALRLGTADAAVEARSVVCLPVLVGGRPVGILEQYASEPHGFDKNDKDLLSSFALQAAVAIENAPPVRPGA
jgi:GAF domain-containing protein